MEELAKIQDERKFGLWSEWDDVDSYIEVELTDVEPEESLPDVKRYEVCVQHHLILYGANASDVEVKVRKFTTGKILSIEEIPMFDPPGPPIIDVSPKLASEMAKK